MKTTCPSRRIGLALFVWLALAACSEDGTTPEPGDLEVEADSADEDADATDAINNDAPDEGDQGGPMRDDEALEAYCGDDYAAIEDRLDALLAALTLDEKISLMHGSLGAPIGGAWEAGGLPAHAIPPLRMLDGPRGVSAVAGNGTAFPVAMARGATWDRALEEQVGEAIGREVRAKGASVVLAPMLNLVMHPRWGRAQEGYGEDPVLVGDLGVAFILGAQRHVLASAKHLAANNIENTRFEVNAVLDERTLRELYLPHFRRAVEEAGVASVMSAYNRVNGTYASESAALLRDLLKGEWRFQGFVESDWYLGTQSTVPAALGGLDIEMPAARFFGSRLAQAVADGEVEEAVIDEAARRVLRAVLCFDLDSNPPEREAAVIESTEHLALALEVARRGMVLLKNEAGLLPLDVAAAPSVVVLGALAAVANLGDTGSSNVAPSAVVTPLQGLTDALGEAAVTYLPDGLTSEEARATAAAADVVIVFAGMTSADEGESMIAAGDRVSMALRAEQIALIESATGVSDAVVVVLEGGSAITMVGWLEGVEALLMAWYPGQQGGTAIADVLMGVVNPSGRLPLSFPAAESDLPPFDNTSLEVIYPRYHGYRHLDRDGTIPLFAFGFGLSYTAFAYGAPRVERRGDAVRVEVEVTNTGERAGRETVQVYVEVSESALERAPRELKGFGQIVLEPGASGTVAVSIPVASLAYWDVEGAEWRVEAAEYRFYVGSSSRDLDSDRSATVELP